MNETHNGLRNAPSGFDMRRVSDLRPYTRNARTHSKKQVRKIANSIERFGFLNPILVDGEATILCGHGRLEAAKLLGMERVPVLVAEHMSEAEKKAYIIADNRIADEAGWDREVLALELEYLVDLDFEIELTGFEIAEIDVIIGDNNEAKGKGPDPEDEVPAAAGPAITRAGDLWCLGNHRLLCGDARDGEAYRALLGEEKARMVFTDPPYNVAISGHVGGLGKTKHREFAMASGEMSEEAFTAFLTTVFERLAAAGMDGSLHYVCMDWRHLPETLAAGREAYEEIKNVCVWNKTNGGMGSLYRSKHELVLIFKKGTAAHINNVELGASGRYRTNVWDYAGVNTFRAGRMDELSVHPTVKPVALVADAIRDVSKRGEIVLDVLAGSGTTLVAAEKTGRRGYGMEIDPLYCDTILRRYEALTGKRAIHAETRLSFEEIAEERLSSVPVSDVPAESEPVAAGEGSHAPSLAAPGSAATTRRRRCGPGSKTPKSATSARRAA